jgi:hypothetical protein
VGGEQGVDEVAHRCGWLRGEGEQPVLVLDDGGRRLELLRIMPMWRTSVLVTALPGLEMSA